MVLEEVVVVRVYVELIYLLISLMAILPGKAHIDSSHFKGNEVR